MKQQINCICLLFFCVFVNAQNNQLTSVDFDAILVNDIAFSVLKKSKADKEIIKKLLGEKVVFIDSSEDAFGQGERKVVVNSKFEFYFTDINSEYFTPELVYLKTDRISIKGKTAHLNDNYSVLGLDDTVVKNHDDGTKSIIYIRENADCCAFVIETNASGIILKIEYFVWT